MEQGTNPTTCAQLRACLRRCPGPVSPDSHALVHGLANQVYGIRQAILDPTVVQHNYDDLQAWVDELEKLGAEGWAVYVGERRYIAELQREHEGKMDEINENLEKLEKRKKSLKKDVKKLTRNLKDLKQENRALRRLLVQHSEHVTAEDHTTLGTLHRDMNLILTELKHFKTHEEVLDDHEPEIRGGMGGQIENEEHVYSFTKYNNWDQVDEENAAAGPKVDQNGKGTVEEKVTVAPEDPCDADDYHCPCHDDGSPEPFGIHMIYLNEGFTFPSSIVSDTPNVFTTPIIVCHFPHGGEHHSTTWKRIWQRYRAKYGPDAISTLRCIYSITRTRPAVHHNLRQAIIASDPMLRESIESLWAPEGQGETYIVTDQSLAPQVLIPLVWKEPSMRGGGGVEDLEAIQTPSEVYTGLAEEFDRLYDQLILKTLRSCADGPSSVCIKAWMSVAGILQLRNRYLERQFEEMKEMHGSVVEDLRWNMEMVAALEDKLQTAEEEKANAFVELGFLKKSMKKGAKDHKKRKEAPRPPNPTPSQEPPSKPSVFDSPTISKCPPTRAAEAELKSSSATCFYFYPLRPVIILPGSPAQILQFPRGTTLKDIRKILNAQHKRGLNMDPCAEKVREIMDARDKMGIKLPESLLDQAIMIGIPETSQEHTMADNTVKIAAWETVDNEEYVELVPRTKDDQRDSVQRGTVPASSKDDRFIQIADIINSFEYDPVTANAELSDSVCSCNLCAADVLLNSTATTYRPPIVSVRGGGDDDWDDDDDGWDDNRRYGYGGYDSDDDDDEVDHEDEAEDPWDDYEIDGQDSLGVFSWHPEDSEPSDEQKQPHMRGGASNRKEEWQRVWEEHVRSTRESAPSPTHRILPPRRLTPDFYDEDGYFRDDMWRANYKRVKNDPSRYSYCDRTLGESPLPMTSFLSSYRQTGSPAQLTRRSDWTDNERRLCASVTHGTREDDGEDEARTMDWLSPRFAPQNVTSTSDSSESIHNLRRAFSDTTAVTTARRKYARRASKPRSCCKRPWLCRRILGVLRDLVAPIKRIMHQATPKADPRLRAGRPVPTPLRKCSPQDFELTCCTPQMSLDKPLPSTLIRSSIGSLPPAPLRKDTPPIPPRSPLRPVYQTIAVHRVRAEKPGRPVRSSASESSNAEQRARKYMRRRRQEYQKNISKSREAARDERW